MPGSRGVIVGAPVVAAHRVHFVVHVLTVARQNVTCLKPDAVARASRGYVEFRKMSLTSRILACTLMFS